MKKLLLSLALLTSGANIFGAASSAPTAKQMSDALQTFKALLKEEIPKVTVVRPIYNRVLSDLTGVEAFIQRGDVFGAQEALRRLEPGYTAVSIGKDGFSLDTWMSSIRKGKVPSLADWSPVTPFSA